MRFPFVSRTEYERVCLENDRLHTLLKLAVSVKTRKAKRPSPAVPATPPEPIAPGIQWAIEQRSGGDPFLRRYLNRFAQEEMARNATPEMIVERIRNGDADEE